MAARTTVAIDRVIQAIEDVFRLASKTQTNATHTMEQWVKFFGIILRPKEADMQAKSYHPEGSIGCSCGNGFKAALQPTENPCYASA